MSKFSIKTKIKLFLALLVVVFMLFSMTAVQVFAQITPFYFEDFEDNTSFFVNTNGVFGSIIELSATGTPPAYSGTRVFNMQANFEPDRGEYLITSDPLKPNATSSPDSDAYAEMYVYITGGGCGSPLFDFTSNNVHVAMDFVIENFATSPDFLKINCNGDIDQLRQNSQIFQAPVGEWFKMAIEYDYVNARYKGYVNDFLVREEIVGARNVIGVNFSTNEDPTYVDDFAYYDAISYDTFSNPPPAIISQSIDYETRFTGGVVSGASTSLQFDIDYFLDTNEFTASNRPDAININVLANGFLNDNQVDNVKSLILPLTTGTSTKTLISSHNYVDGDYIAFVNFFNLNNDSLTFTNSNIVIDFTVFNGVVTVSNVQSITDGSNISGNVYQDCGITNIYGCFVNGLTYAFTPQPNSLDRFTGLYENIETKPPFGYVTGILDALNGMNGSTTPAFDFGNVPFIDTIFTPFKALLAIGLWVIYALFFMGRLSRIDI